VRKATPIKVRKGQKVAVLSGGNPQIAKLAVNVEARGLKLRPFADPAPHRTIVLAWRKNSPLRDALRKIGATLRSAAGVQ
jgi:hypothetical protein